MFIKDEYESITAELESFIKQKRRNYKRRNDNDNDVINGELNRANFIERMLIKYRLKCMMIPKMINILD